MRLPLLPVVAIALLLAGEPVALAVRTPKTVPGFLRQVARRMDADRRARTTAPLLRRAAHDWYKHPAAGRNAPRGGSVVVKGRDGSAKVSTGTDRSGGLSIRTVVYDKQGHRVGSVSIDQPNLTIGQQRSLQRLLRR